MQISQHGPCVFYTLVVYACYYSICKNMLYFNVYSYDIFCLILKQNSITSTYLLC
jgi:hypothetical protein